MKEYSFQHGDSAFTEEEEEIIIYGEIACERILTRSTGGAYDDLRHRDNWILVLSDLVCFEGQIRHSRRVFRLFLRGSRKILPVSSLHRASTDALMIMMMMTRNS